MKFDPPLDDLTPIVFVAKALLDAHAAILRREGLVASGLAMTLTIEGRAPVVIEQRWGAATIPGSAELDALRLTLDANAVTNTDDLAPPRITAVSLTLLDCVVDAGEQLPLQDAESVLRRAEVARLLTRLRTLYGPNGIREAILTASHLPEGGWITRPYDAARVGTPIDTVPAMPSSGVLAAAPGFVVLRPPQPITLAGSRATLVIHLDSDEAHPIISSIGPYHAAGEWWSAERYDRAYWLLLTNDNALHLVAEDHRTAQWARYGVYR